MKCYSFYSCLVLWLIMLLQNFYYVNYSSSSSSESSRFLFIYRLSNVFVCLVYFKFNIPCYKCIILSFHGLIPPSIAFSYKIIRRLRFCFTSSVSFSSFLSNTIKTGNYKSSMFTSSIIEGNIEFATQLDLGELKKHSECILLCNKAIC